MQLLQNILYFAVWAGFIFLMMRYGCGAHIMGHGHHHGATGSDDQGGKVGVPLSSRVTRTIPVLAFGNEPECVLCDLLRYLHYRVSDLSGLTDQSRGTLYLSSRLRAADLANLPARPDREFRLGLVHRTDLRASI